MLRSLLFLATCAISIYSLIYYRKNGYLPGSRPEISDPMAVEAQKYAFSSNPHDEPEDNNDGVETGIAHPPRGRDNGGDEYALLHTDTHEGHPGRPLSWGREPSIGHHDEADHHPSGGPYHPAYRQHGEQDTAYHGGGAYDPHQPQHLEDPFKDPTNAPTLKYQPGDPFRYELSSNEENKSYGGSDERVNFPHADYTR